MTDEKTKYYLTTPIYYANSRPHVGSAYTTIVCDAIARYKRMCGFEVAYVTGTDEHGVNIERAAEAKGVSPQKLVDQNEAIFRDLWKLLGISITDFVRTTSPEHERAVQTLVRRTMKRTPDAIYKRRYEGRYCIYDNAYVSDTPEPAQCQICGRDAELISEENYFFRLSAYGDRLLELYKTHPDFVQPDFRMNEVRAFVEAGLKDLSISRQSIKWGIPWPDDSDHVFYVWYDALTSYMTAIGYGEGADGDASPKFKKFWPADLHMIGKEIIRFHAIYWPAFLMAAELPLPEKIFAHGWLLFEQEKMSKSKGNVAYPEPIAKTLGNDALRYYLMREVVFGQDGNFSRDALITRYNADLANGLGNLCSRTLTMIQNYFGGVIPEATPAPQRLFEVTSGAFHGMIRKAYEHFEFSEALTMIWGLVAVADKFLANEKPWTLAEDPAQRARLEQILYSVAESVRVLSVLAHPVIPESTQKIWEQLGQLGRIEDERIDRVEWGAMKGGTRIGTIEAVFPRADKKEILEKIEAMENEIRNPGATPAPAAAQGATEADVPKPSGAAPAAPAAAAPAAAAPAGDGKITIDDFTKVELKVGLVQSAERVEKADKLLKLLVDMGDEVRQVLSGIAQWYSPEEMVGRKVIVVTNLAPRKMRGIESNGMILAASSGPDTKPVLCTFAEDIPVGSKVK
jgi:methionyl-tRNA synthetase